MKNLKYFLKYQAQTSKYPMGLEINRANGVYLYDKDGKSYIDFIAGLSVNNLGHGNPKIIKAIKEQLDNYMHIMVYGEFIQNKCVVLCKKLADYTPASLETTYLVNSGAEAIDGAIKLAKRFTGRHEVISCNMAYHGNTLGALSLMGNEIFKKNFQPLIPMIKFINFNDEEDILNITENTACVIIETIQGAAGFILPKNNYLIKIKKQCEKNGSLMILDEIQPGFGRTGKLFAFEHYNVVPDILVIGKAMGGGLPIGAFMSSFKIMKTLSYNPPLGHITTFGGNPVIASSALAMLDELINSNIMNKVLEKEILFRKLLVHKKIKKIYGKGLMLACEFINEDIAYKLIKLCLNNGLIIFYMLFSKKCIRISPPLTISNTEIYKGCKIFLKCLDKI